MGDARTVDEDFNEDDWQRFLTEEKAPLEGEPEAEPVPGSDEDADDDEILREEGLSRDDLGDEEDPNDPEEDED